MNKAKLVDALKHADVQEPVFLGEGAWHYAWQVKKDGGEFVLRIPKEEAYGKSIPFNEAMLKADYGGTKLYYQSVNKAVVGATPEFYEFHVSPELIYTLETFAGKQIDLHKMTEKTAFQTGQEVGMIHRKTEEISHELEGFGNLAWTQEKGLHGTFERDANEFLEEESEEHIADYRVLGSARSEFKDPLVSRAIQLAADLRNRQFTKPLLVNQDVSPENILLDGGRIRLIDPYPSIYYSRGMAGNFMNLYETYFITLADTERYSKHRFSESADQLKSMAEGFLAGYSAGDSKVANEVRGEQLLQLLETAFSHFCLLSEEISEETRIQYGNKAEIEERLLVLAEELKALAASQIAGLESTVSG
ncbi:hypothetical protein BBH88_12450 [Planococcus antarcticus DSM 14505]|uniref:Aminoglycoside phosphotransferase domain-containing protein n=1 Tax=Planococcus antarcticus DSM 14505 TaxID=1185653 RepID=A0ABN4RGC0_9BACL|nr:hypothetical protein [Planococcus antarcticus]ANU11050.1 hypothetical protein BBH88_12450 [Planococcus antarcticus DSM 14505]